MSLAALQRAFQAHVVRGDDAIVPLVTVDQRRGLPVYVYAYRATLRAALRDTFEKTALWLGDSAFDAAADAYIDRMPSRSWTLADYGDAFAAHLAEQMRDDPEVGELAWLDWALRAAFAAQSLPPVDPDALAALDWQTATLRLAPHLAFRSVATNVVAVWNGLPTAPVAVAHLPAPAGVIVWRSDLTPEFRSADPLEVRALWLLASGCNFGEMCEALAAAGHGDPTVIGGLLSVWLGHGLIAISDPSA